MAHKAIKTEHGGAKKGGSGYWGHRSDAKKDCRKARRRNDRKAVKEGAAA